MIWVNSNGAKTRRPGFVTGGNGGNGGEMRRAGLSLTLTLSHGEREQLSSVDSTFGGRRFRRLVCEGRGE